jgi:hypothetical protein
LGLEQRVLVEYRVRKRTERMVEVNRVSVCNFFGSTIQVIDVD